MLKESLCFSTEKKEFFQIIQPDKQHIIFSRPVYRRFVVTWAPRRAARARPDRQNTIDSIQSRSIKVYNLGEIHSTYTTLDRTTWNNFRKRVENISKIKPEMCPCNSFNFFPITKQCKPNYLIQNALLPGLNNNGWLHCGLRSWHIIFYVCNYRLPSVSDIESRYFCSSKKS